jgi:hypothetical protein
MPYSLKVKSASSVSQPGRKNEDIIGYTEHAVWVLDGATGLSNSSASESDAARYVRIVNDILRKKLSAPNGHSTKTILDHTLHEARERILRELGNLPDEPYLHPSATFGMVRTVEDKLEITLLGDCTVSVVNNGSINRFTDDRIGPFEQRSISALRAQRKRFPNLSMAEAKESIRPAMLENRKLMNRSDGYWVLSTNLENSNEAICEEINLSDVDSLRVLVMSDGVSRLHELFDHAGWETGAATEASAESPIDRLRHLERLDHDCLDFPRMKVFDDASLAICEVRRGT